MMKANSSWLKRTLAMLLVVVTLIGFIPTSVIATAAEALRSNDYIPGDVNGDGEINAMDVNLLRRYIVGGYGITINTLAADVDANGALDAQDVSCIRRHIVGGYDVELKPGLEPEASTYSVHFYDADRLIDTLTAQKDQPLGAVPAVEKSSKANAILLGYFTDPECTQPFYAENPVTSDMNVYAKYEEMGSTEELNFTSFAQMDQTPDITFVVVGEGDPSENITLEAKDGSDPVALQFEATEGGYIVSAVGGFNEGCSYQLHLADGWTFKDKDETIRTASFSIAMEQVENLQMRDDIVYILDTDAISYTVGGQSYEMLTSELITEAGGSFTYAGAAALNVDTLLCIYIGTHPEERNYDGDMLDPAYYVKVKAIDGTTVTFTALGDNDFLRLYNVPDNFPIQVDALPTGTTGTVNISKLDKEMYVTMQGEDYDLAKAKTLIEVGDFISLYVTMDAFSTDDDVYFGQITAYDAQTGEITYMQTTKQAILDCMDLYRDIEIAGNDLVTEEEKENLEATILQQIEDSGFAEDAAFMLADMVSKTDGFKDTSLQNLLITDSQGNEIAPEQLQLMNLGKTFELSDDIKLTVEIITEGEQLHFKKGTQIAVGVEAGFEVELEDDEKIAIELKATFVQEVQISPKIKGYVVPYVIFIIPVPVGANVNGTVDIKSFTAFSFEAEVLTVAPEDESLWDQLKDVMNNPEKLADIEGLPSELSAGLKTVGDVLDKIEEKKDELSKLKDTAEDIIGTAEAYAEDIALLWDSIEYAITEEEYSEICEALDKTNITSDLLDMMELTNETGLETEYYESMEALMERYCEMVEKETDWVTLLEEDVFDIETCVYGVAIGVDIDFLVRADLSLAIGSNLQYEVGKRYEFWFKFAPFWKKAGCDTMDLLDEKFAFQFYVMGRLGLKAGIKGKLECGIGSCKLANVGVSIELGPYFKLWGFFVYENEKYRPANTKKWYCDERMAGALLMEFGLYFKLACEAEAISTFSYEYEFLDKEVPIVTIGEERFYYQPNYQPEEDEIMLVKDADGNSTNGIAMTLPDYTLALDYVNLKEAYMAIDIPDYDNFIYTFSNPNFSIDPKTGEISVNVPEGIRYMECDLTITYKYGKLAFSTFDMSVTVPLVWTNMDTTEMSEYYTASVRVGNDADGYTTVWNKRVRKNAEFDLPTVEQLQKMMGWNDYKYDMGTGYGNQQTEGLTLIDNAVYDFNVTYDSYSIKVADVEMASGRTVTRTYTAKYGKLFNFANMVFTGTSADGVYHKFTELTHDIEGLDLTKTIDTRMAAILAQGVTVQANYIDDSTTALFTFVGLDTEDVTLVLRRGETPDLTQIQNIADAAGVTIQEITPAVTPISSSTMYQVICNKVEAPSATITFQENGGSDVEDITKPTGGLIGALPTPTKDGYNFGGWFTDEALTQSFAETNMPEGGATLYAKWTAKTYTITLHVNGGNELETNKVRVPYGSAYGQLPKPERVGYGFIGWFTAAEGGQQITEETINNTAGSQTLYAHWRELIVLPENSIDFGDKTFTYEYGKTYNADHIGKSYVLPDDLTLEDFTYEFICEGYEDEGYVTDVMEAGTWGVKISRPADDTYAKFETFQPGVLIIEKAKRDLTGTTVSQVGSSITYVELALSSEIVDIDENAQVKYSIGVTSLGAFISYGSSEVVSYGESVHIRDISPNVVLKAVRISVLNDRNYEDETYITTGSYYTILPSGDSWANHADTSWYLDNPGLDEYTIFTPAQLAGLAKLVNDGTTTFNNRIISLATNLDMSAYTWTPIGIGAAKCFSGNFNGNGLTISGLYYSNANTANVGLFGYVSGSDDFPSICDLVIDNSYFYGYTRVGGIVGCAEFVDIYNCVNYAYIKADEKGSKYESCAGGIAGELQEAFVYNCVNYGKVYSEGRLTGGIVGLIDESGEVLNCVNFGSVTGSSRVGGIVGCTDGDYAGAFNNYNMGKVRPNDGSNDYIGAIVGRNVDDNGGAQFNYYLYGCAQGGNEKNRYAMGNDGGSVEDGKKGYIASSFETYESPMKSSADTCAGKVLLDALNDFVSYYDDYLTYWVYEGPDGYPIPENSPTSSIRLVP